MAKSWHSAQAFVAGPPRCCSAMYAAGQTTPDIAYLPLGSLLGTTNEGFTEPELAGKITAVGGTAARRPLPGPTRRELLAAIGV